jgi:hypothetical protein
MFVYGSVLINDHNNFYLNINGIFIAFVTALLTGVIAILEKGTVFDWTIIKPVLIAAISAALSYLPPSFYNT